MYSKEKLTAMAKQIGFQKRSSKLSPSMFLDTVLFKELDNGAVSLNDHCISLFQQYGIQITKQSLSERFNEDSVNFVKTLLTDQINTQLSTKLKEESLGEVLRQFKSVKIKDSTRFQIPSEFKDRYPGSTGSSSGAGVHVQFEFDILSGRVNTLDHTDARTADNHDILKTMGHIEAGDLILRDLGYFSSQALRYFDEHQAFFVTRSHGNMNLYTIADGEKFSYDRIYKEMKKNKLSQKEMLVRNKYGLTVRLIVEMIPPQEAAKRMKAISLKKKRGVKKTNGKCSSQLTKDSKARAHLNLFITNIPPDRLSTNHVRKLYQLRWQIELRFKAWKSFYHLSATKGMSLRRFECYLYASLLLIMINWEIATNINAILWAHTGKPLSILKFYKTTSQNIGMLRTVVLKGQTDYLMILYQMAATLLFAEKRNNHDGPLQELLTL